MQIQVSAFSRTGGRERNEDACGYVEREGVVCCVLADGAGGHGGGNVASRTCVQTVLDAFVARAEVSSAATAGFLEHANDAVLSRQKTGDELTDMRSTAIVLVFDAARALAIWGHVGDSRLYLFRQGLLHLRTRDHSMVQTMVDNGILRAEDAVGHPDANILFTSLGLADAFLPEILDAPCPLVEGDAFLLCSDGLWGAMPESALASCLARARSADEWLYWIEQEVAGQLQTGSDNYSAIAVWCGDPGDSMRTQPRHIG